MVLHILSCIYMERERGRARKTERDMDTDKLIKSKRNMFCQKSLIAARLYLLGAVFLNPGRLHALDLVYDVCIYSII